MLSSLSGLSGGVSPNLPNGSNNNGGSNATNLGCSSTKPREGTSPGLNGQTNSSGNRNSNSQNSDTLNGRVNNGNGNNTASGNNSRTSSTNGVKDELLSPNIIVGSPASLLTASSPTSVAAAAAAATAAALSSNPFVVNPYYASPYGQMTTAGYHSADMLGLHARAYDQQAQQQQQQVHQQQSHHVNNLANTTHHSLSAASQHNPYNPYGNGYASCFGNGLEPRSNSVSSGGNVGLVGGALDVHTGSNMSMMSNGLMSGGGHGPLTGNSIASTTSTHSSAMHSPSSLLMKAAGLSPNSNINNGKAHRSKGRTGAGKGYFLFLFYFIFYFISCNLVYFDFIFSIFFDLKKAI